MCRTVGSRHTFSEKQRAGAAKLLEIGTQMIQQSDENPGNGPVVDLANTDTPRSMASA